ncbi:VWA domain-containing protein [Fulvivirga kasyanovii]|uniref:VWA domain-containing protein n=1 Tax=Fulvivirga kasyanovii TaxID=396812 RepID=A0ABW9RJD0_9BACT|nr:VWA domain-containing protein [Fulvivirga kasyanovii]MTI24187.1 VWA domain-containing protein [Fulvivirga kasyanovii]
MTWLYSLSGLEITFIALFVAFYLLYLIRVISIAKKLSTPYGSVFIKLSIRSIYFALFIVALLGPSFGESKREVKSVGKDIFVLVDLSQSMNANDVQPTRLEKVKFELKNIVEAFNSDRIGIIIFSSEAFMQVPLTFDQNALNLFIETLYTNLVPNTGTDFTPPLQLALNKLNSEESPITQQKSKVIILISDGEDFGEETEEVAQEIEDQGIKLYTLGVGTERGSKIRVNGVYKKNREGNDVVTKLDSRTLKKLASETGGKYFEINETNNDVSRLINTINNIEGELRDTRQIDVSANRYYYFLGIALLLLVIDLLTSVKTIKI